MSFTSESVTIGHPDKVADQISDAILDAYLAEDPNARVACETLVTTGQVVVAGEITSTAVVDIPQIVRDTIKWIGYTDSRMGFDYKSCGIMVNIDKQSPDISQGVTADQGLFKEEGAGDQGMMFGYATDETPEFMPLPISLAHKLCKQLVNYRRNRNTEDILLPDGKAQVTVDYDRISGMPKRVNTIVVSTQHINEWPEGGVVRHKDIEAVVEEFIIPQAIPKKWIDNDTKIFVNPTGRFVIGGPHGDCGLTGRKIIVDTYGGICPHGGGAFSGKDPSKVDRSAHYMARYIAKNMVAAGFCNTMTLQLAYAIGVAEPVSLDIRTEGCNDFGHDELEKIIRKHFNMTPAGIIHMLDLRRPIYKATARNGHFGHKEFPWEQLNKVDDLKSEIS